ncbi:MAG: SH3 domain-containing protein [Pyrinomonadaceae bacterium]
MKFIKLLLSVCFLLVLNGVAFSQTASVSVSQANIREKPSMKGKVIDVLEESTSLDVIEQKGSWFLVKTSDLEGWMHENTIALNKDEKDSSKDDENDSSKGDKSASGKNDSGKRKYIRGPRGGCYYINSNGNKTYVSRTLCN